MLYAILEADASPRSAPDARIAPSEADIEGYPLETMLRYGLNWMRLKRFRAKIASAMRFLVSHLFNSVIGSNTEVRFQLRMIGPDFIGIHSLFAHSVLNEHDNVRSRKHGIETLLDQLYSQSVGLHSQHNLLDQFNHQGLKPFRGLVHQEHAGFKARHPPSQAFGAPYPKLSLRTKPGRFSGSFKRPEDLNDFCSVLDLPAHTRNFAAAPAIGAR